MKAFLALILAAAILACVADDLVDLSELPPLQPETQESLAKLFSLALFKYLEKTKLVKNENERVPLPEFPVDEIQLDSISLRISNESEIANLIHGELDLCEITLGGLTSIAGELDFDMSERPKGKFHLKLTTGTIRMDALQELKLTLLQRLQLTASEDFYLRLHNFTLDVWFEIENVINIFGKIKVTAFELDVAGDGFEMYLENTEAPFPTDEEGWLDFSGRLSTLFKLVWPRVKDAVNEFLFVFVADFVKECSLNDFRNRDFTCLGAKGGEDFQDMILDELSIFVDITKSEICPAESTPGSTPTTIGTTVSTTTDSSGTQSTPGSTPTTIATTVSTTTDSSGSQVQFNTILFSVLVFCIYY